MRRIIEPCSRGFLQQGLERREKILYFSHAHPRETILGYLQDTGTDVTPYLESGQLNVQTFNELLRLNGPFTPDTLIAWLKKKSALAHKEGYSALRITGEMTGLMQEILSLPQTLEYEAKLNFLTPNSRCLLLCQYDQRCSDPDLLLEVLRTHPQVLISTERYENLYYIPPHQYLEGSSEDKLQIWIEGLVDRKQAAETLQENERIFRSVVEQTTDGIMLFDEQGKIVKWNKAMEQLSNISSKEALGQDAWDIMLLLTDPERKTPANRQRLQRSIRELQTQHRHNAGKRTMEQEIFRQDGTSRTALLSFFTIKTRRGFMMGSTIRDITEQKRTAAILRKHRDHLEELVKEHTSELNRRVEEVERLNSAMANLLEDFQATNTQLKKTHTQLRKSNQELESFAYSVSHDLRAPLRSIDGFSHILQEEYAAELSAEAFQYLNIVRENAQEMGQLIDDLLTFSRLSRKGINKQLLRPTPLVKELFQELLRLQPDREVKFHLSELPACEADPNLLKQVWTNLLSNALKYTRERDVAEIEVGSCEKNGQSSYFIKDNGVGFDMAYADKLFGVFQRLHRAEDYEGTGVGLALVQRIVRRHGGRVWAEAEPDKGATFYFTI